MTMRHPLPRDHFATPLKQTPFHPRIAALMQAEAWYGWSGWLSAQIVRDEEIEYFAIRNAATLFDVSPIVKYRVEGTEAVAYLDRLLVTRVDTQPVGRAQYTAWCDDEGKILDDGLLFRHGPASFVLCAQERHLDWLLASAVGFDVAVEEITERLAGLALQGPTSFAVLAESGLGEVAATLKPQQFRPVEIPGVGPVTLSRTGFTGDLGYEVFLAPEQALPTWDLMWEAGQRHGITAIGAGALELARLEAGHVLSGSEFLPAADAIRADRRRSPFEIGLAWMVALDKPCHFNGRRALLAEKRNNSSKHCLVGLEIDGNVPAEHAFVYHRGKREVGHVTVAAWSPTTKRNIALASLERPYGDTVTGDLWVEIYALRELVYTKTMVRARIVERPFFKPARRAATPPGQT